MEMCTAFSFNFFWVGRLGSNVDGGGGGGDLVSLAWVFYGKEVSLGTRTSTQVQ